MFLPHVLILAMEFVSDSHYRRLIISSLQIHSTHNCWVSSKAILLVSLPAQKFFITFQYLLNKVETPYLDIHFSYFCRPIIHYPNVSKISSLVKLVPTANTIPDTISPPHISIRSQASLGVNTHQLECEK